jgi:hypothetical protein
VFIRIPYGTRYTATYRLRVWIPQRCEHCGAQFAYAAAKEAEGTSLNLLWLNSADAQSRAQQEAEQAILAAIGRVRRTIPCPECARYSSEHEETLRARWRRGGFAASSVLAITWAVMAAVQPFGLFARSPASIGLLVLAALSTVITVWRLRTMDLIAAARRHTPRRREYRRLTEAEYRDLSSAGFAIAEDEPATRCPQCTFCSMNDFATYCPNCQVPLVEYSPAPPK